MNTSKTIEFRRLADRLKTRNLGTRFAGASIRHIITASFNETDRFVFDFSEVESISSSFADECFAKLLCDFDFEKIKDKTTFRNTSPFIKARVSDAFKNRLASFPKKTTTESIY